MSDALIISCPKCWRKLRVRAQYVGKKLHCASCHHIFRPVSDTLDPGATMLSMPSPLAEPVQTAASSPASQPPEPSPASQPPAPAARPAVAAPARPPAPLPDGQQARINELQIRLHDMENSRAVLQANHGAALAALQQKEKDLGRLQELFRNLQHRLDQAQKLQQDLSATQQELELARREADLLRMRTQVIERQAAQADRIQVELEATRTALARAQKDLKESSQREQQLTVALHDIQPARIERDRLQTELTQSQEHLTAAGEEKTRLEQVIAGLEVVRGERERLLEDKAAESRAREAAEARCHELELTLEQSAHDREAIQQERQQHDAAQKRLEEEKASLQRELEFCRQEIAVLQEAAKNLGFTPTYVEPEIL